ncbi:MAG: hypothetical protein ABIG87_00445 [Patescibacteria group bacterium]
MRKKINKRIFQIAFVFFICGFFLIARGADFSNANQEMIITSNPQYPAANQTITLKAEIYITDINRAEILWFVDNKLKKAGVGLKEFSFTTKGLGETTIINIQVNTVDVGQINKQIKIIPVDIDLVWEADSYTPPFYKGKALNTHETVMKMVALPDFIDSYGKKIDAKNLIYKWEKNWKVDNNQSGYGKNSFSFIGPKIFEKTVISVTVESLDGLSKSKKNLSIPTHNPEIIFFEKDPLLGIMDNNALQNIYNQDREELLLVARPFFFSTQDLKRSAKCIWTMNGKIIDNSSTEIVLRKKEGDTGSSVIALEIQNLKKIMQFASNDFTINFD